MQSAKAHWTSGQRENNKRPKQKRPIRKRANNYHKPQSNKPFITWQATIKRKAANLLRGKGTNDPRLGPDIVNLKLWNNLSAQAQRHKMMNWLTSDEWRPKASTTIWNDFSSVVCWFVGVLLAGEKCVACRCVERGLIFCCSSEWFFSRNQSFE